MCKHRGGGARPDPQFTPTSSRQPSQPDTAAELLGEASTIDPCGLLGTETLQRYGTVRQAPAESFDYCRIDVVVPSGGTAAVRFGELTRIDGEPALAAEGAQEVPGVGRFLRVFHQSLDEDSCTGKVLFADLVTLTVTADTFDSPQQQPIAELCDLVKDVTAEIVARLERGNPVEHVDHPPSSIGALDACAALSDAAVGAALGQSAARMAYPAGHQCRWGQTGPSLSVRYVKGEPATGDDVSQETIAGRTTYLFGTEVGDRSLCLAETQPSVAGELAQVVVRLAAGQVEPACQAARAITEDVWSDLPS